ncbi:hypothetical protein [Nocardioides sp. HB32]
MSGTNITVDVTNWPTPARIELLELIDTIEARLSEDTPVPAPALEIPDEVEPSGWNQEAYHTVIRGLLDRYPAQISVIFEAIKNGTGYVSRDRVYELGHFSDGRSLKGFTRPVNRLTAEAVEKGLLPDEDVEDLLLPDYDPNVKGFQRARGFIVPAEVVKMANEWRREAQRSREAS